MGVNQWIFRFTLLNGLTIDHVRSGGGAGEGLYDFPSADQVIVLLSELFRGHDSNDLQDQPV